MMAPSRPPLTGSNRLVYTVPEAGRLLGLGRNAAYDAARRGDIPTIRLGRLLRVPKAALHKLVGAELSYSRTVGEAEDTGDNTDEDSAESDDEEAVVQVTLHRSQYRASIVSLDSAPDQQDADHSANCGVMYEGPVHIPDPGGSKPADNTGIAVPALMHGIQQMVSMMHDTARLKPSSQRVIPHSTGWKNGIELFARTKTRSRDGRRRDRLIARLGRAGRGTADSHRACRQHTPRPRSGVSRMKPDSKTEPTFEIRRIPLRLIFATRSAALHIEAYASAPTPSVVIPTMSARAAAQAPGLAPVAAEPASAAPT